MSGEDDHPQGVQEKQVSSGNKKIDDWMWYNWSNKTKEKEMQPTKLVTLFDVLQESANTK